MRISLLFESEIGSRGGSEENDRGSRRRSLANCAVNEVAMECTRKCTRIESEQRRETARDGGALSDAFHRLSDRHAAVDAVNVPGGECGFVRGEEDDDRRNFLGLGEPAHRLAGAEGLA